MSRFQGFATLLAVALSWFAVSCAGPVAVKPGAAGGSPILASASVPGTGAAAGQAGGATIAVAQSPWNGSSIYFVGCLLIFVALGASMYVFRGKAPEAV